MKKRWVIVRLSIVVILITVFLIIVKNGEKLDIDKNRCTENEELNEAGQNQGNETQNEEENVQSADRRFWIKDSVADVRDEKIELMNYIELPVGEFIKETGIPLCQDQDNENVWRTEDDLVGVQTKNDRIVMLGMDKIVVDDELKELIDKEGFPYTLAGISLNDQISYAENSILKNACKEEGMLGEGYYGSLYLSKLGIENIHLWSDGGAIGMVAAEIDISLKEAAEGLEYIWEEHVCQKEGSKNDQLKEEKVPYTEFPESYTEAENIKETFVWIKYPYLAIPDNAEMEKNVNEVITEAVRKIEENTYGSTDENIIVDAEYNISYATSKFISICFYVHVRDDSDRNHLWQYCNINMGDNGRKAYLSDLGISKEKVAARCNTGHELGPVDTESYLESYNTNWDQYYIGLREYNIIVKPLYEQKENRKYGERTYSLEITKFSNIMS